MVSFPAKNIAFRHVLTTVAVAMACVLGCATRDRAPGATASPTVATSANATATVGQSAGVQTLDAGSPQVEQGPSAPLDGGVKTGAPISSPCVLHAGQGKRHTHTIRVPGREPAAEPEHGACSANAECIASKGHDTEGDGFVRLECTDRLCHCSLEPAALSGTKPGPTTFELSSPCTTSGRALQLIVERCMSGMVVVHH